MVVAGERLGDDGRDDHDGRCKEGRAGGELQGGDALGGCEGELLVGHAGGLAERGEDDEQQARDVAEHGADVGEDEEVSAVHGDGAERDSEEDDGHGHGDGAAHGALEEGIEAKEHEDRTGLRPRGATVSDASYFQKNFTLAMLKVAKLLSILFFHEVGCSSAREGETNP